MRVSLPRGAWGFQLHTWQSSLCSQESSFSPYGSMGMNNSISIFGISPNINFLSFCHFRARVRTISSGFCAEVPAGNGFDSIASKTIATAYPAHCTLCLTKLLPSVNQFMASRSGFSFRSGWLKYTALMVSRQLCSTGLASDLSCRKEAGVIILSFKFQYHQIWPGLLGILGTLKETANGSISVQKQLTPCEILSHLLS